MGFLKEKYPGYRNDMGQMFKWSVRKTKDWLNGRDYIFTRQDFLDLSRALRYSNWLISRHAHEKWYQRILDFGFGPVENPKIQSRVIPINAKVKKSKNAVLPYQLIDDFIDSAGFKIILNECLCRRGEECKDYPIEFGCIMLGEGARTLLKGGHGREVTAKEAKEHVRKAEGHGLVPFAAHAKAEVMTMGIPAEQHHQFIELCFCCPCCCLAMKNLKYYPPDIHKHNFINVAFAAKALPTCKGCKKCVSACPTDAIHINGNKVWVREDKCIGCGVCQYTCEFDAIQLVQIRKPKGDLIDYFDGRLKLDLS
jgi:ferredoxin